MSIKGAIFDCDGTLVDSMWVWREVSGAFLERHGITPAPELIDRLEPLPMRAVASLLHGECGLCATAEEAYDEIGRFVCDKYAHEVPLARGAREFLAELQGVGIPMAVATSTPAAWVRVALEAQGIGEFFSTVVSTEDVGGRDKDHPDVYEEARRRLATERAATWVFEDAPFGMRTARKAGYPVVGLFNGHDGRDEDDVRDSCDVFARDFRELTLNQFDMWRSSPDAG